MKRIAVSAQDRKGLESSVAAHFGRCPHYVVVDVEGQNVVSLQEIDNPHLSHHDPGEIPAFIHGLGAQVMLAGGMGGRAVAFFQDYGIETVTGAAGTVREALERYLRGETRGASPCRESLAHGHGQEGE